MMRRTPFARKAPASLARVRQYDGDIGPTPRKPATVVLTSARPIVAAPKENAIQHLGYMAAVRLLRCARCGFYRKGTIQFCHADEGKGGMIKTDCRKGWPGCGPHDGLPGCHWLVGTSGRLGKAGRREFESLAGATTRATIRVQGKWPARLPDWPEKGGSDGE